MKSLLALFIICPLFIFGQNVAFEYQELEATYQRGIFSFEDEAGNYIFSSYHDNNCKVYKLNSDGQLLYSTIIQNENFDSNITHIFQDGEHYKCIGKQKNTLADSTNIWTLTLDQDLTILEEASLPFLNQATFYQFNCNEFPDTIICVGNIHSSLESFAFKYVKNSGAIQPFPYLNFQESSTDDILIAPNNPNRYLILGSSNGIMVTDAQFNLIETNDINPFGINGYAHMHELNEDRFLYAGRMTFLNYNVGIAILNYEFDEIAADTIGFVETREHEAPIQCLDINDEFIYFGGTSNVIHPNSTPENSSFFLAKYDLELNKIWEQYYGTDGYNYMMHLEATSDGGCLMTGFKEAFETSPDIHQFYVIKVGPNGEISNTNIITEELNQFKIFPNPASDLIYVESVNSIPQNKSIFIELYNLSGLKLMNKKFNQNSIELDIRNFANGIYFLKIISEKGEVLQVEKMSIHPR